VKLSELTNKKLIINLLDVIPFHPQLPHLILSSCTTSWKVGGVIPDGFTGFFIDLNPSGCTMAWGSTQLLAEMSTKDISWGVKLASSCG